MSILWVYFSDRCHIQMDEARYSGAFIWRSGLNNPRRRPTRVKGRSEGEHARERPLAFVSMRLWFLRRHPQQEIARGVRSDFQIFLLLRICRSLKINVPATALSIAESFKDRGVRMAK